MSQEQDDETSDNDTMGGRIDPFVLIRVRANRVNRHLRALTIERDQFRTELALLREWQREVIQNANLHHAELRDAIARAKRAEAELAAERARLDFMLSLGSIARFSAACSKVKIESTGEQWLHDARRAIDAAMKENYK